LALRPVLSAAEREALLAIPVGAEELAANEGIGHYIELYGSFLQTQRVMLGVVILGLFGVILGALVDNDGESTWQEGAVLVGFYVVIAASFWWGT